MFRVAVPGRARGVRGETGSLSYQRVQDDGGALGAVLAGNGSAGPTVMTVQKSDGYVSVVGCTFARY